VLQNAEALKDYRIPGTPGFVRGGPLAGEKLTTKNLTVGSRLAADAVRDPRSFFEFCEPKNEFEIAGPTPLSRDRKKLGKKFRLATGKRSATSLG
jgi:hypothetical protein